VSEGSWRWDVKTLEWYSDSNCNNAITHTQDIMESGNAGGDSTSFWGPHKAFDGNQGSGWGGRPDKDPNKNSIWVGMGGLSADVRCLRMLSGGTNVAASTYKIAVEKLVNNKWELFTECTLAKDAVSTCQVPASKPAAYQCRSGQIKSTNLGGVSSLAVTPVCLPGNIAGPLEIGNIFGGPSPMHVVADPKVASSIYFSWTEDIPFGMAEDGSEGRIHVTKVTLNDQSSTISGSASFNGFVRTGGVDITDDGVVATLCAKYVPKWVRSFLSTQTDGKGEQNAPMMLAVCEVTTRSMTPVGTPWRIGKHWETGSDTVTKGGWGNYPIASWFAEKSAGYGWLTYAPAHKTWTAWYGATVGHHTGYAMHTYERSARSSGAPYALPVSGVQNREEIVGQWVDHNRWGTGDHQGGSATRYHPIIHDIGLQKHNDVYNYMQQYGLETPSGSIFKPGHGTNDKGRLYMRSNGDEETVEGSLRPCGQDWITAFRSKNGNTCSKVSRDGQIMAWNIIDSSQREDHYGKYGKYTYGNHRMVRLATLGSKEVDAQCGSSARFLMGYETKDERRHLVELDGNCQKVHGPFDVTDAVTWSSFEEWTTTADGAVVWVTAWEKSFDGKEDKFNKWGTREVAEKQNQGLKTWTWTNHDSDGAHNEAQVITYRSKQSSKSGCSDSPSDWSAEGEVCASYDVLDYCTSDGKEGSGWMGKWGAISDWRDSNGLSALDACCACGGGSFTVQTNVVV